MDMVAVNLVSVGLAVQQALHSNISSAPQATLLPTKGFSQPGQSQYACNFAKGLYTMYCLCTSYIYADSINNSVKIYYYLSLLLGYKCLQVNYLSSRYADITIFYKYCYSKYINAIPCSQTFRYQLPCLTGRGCASVLNTHSSKGRAFAKSFVS